MSENIDREIAINAFDANKPFLYSFNTYYPEEVRSKLYAINAIPIEDIQLMKHGKWIEKPHWVPLPWDCLPSQVGIYDKNTHSEQQMWWHCSCCDYEPSRTWKPSFKYCPNCGAKMDGGT